MGYPVRSASDHEVEARSKPLTPLDRLKAMARFMRSKSTAAMPPLVLSTRDMVDAPASAHDRSSILSADVEMTGTLISSRELHIYGAVEGDVRAAGLTIFAGGSVKGEIVAESVLVHGVVEGRIRADNVQLFAGAAVRGEIVHGSLGVDTGSSFEGVSKRSDDPQAEAKLPALKHN